MFHSPRHSNRSRCRNLLPVVLAALVVVGWVLPCSGGVVEGIVLSRQGPVAGGRIEAFSSYEKLAGGSPAAVSEPGEKAGLFRLDLPAGSYFITAHGTLSDGTPGFSYHGLNPLTVGDVPLWLPIFLSETTAASCEAGPTGIGGTLTYKNEPLPHGVVSAYPLQHREYRGMGLLTNTLDEEGNFWFDLPAGRYVLIGRKRQGDIDIGPVERGDLYCYTAANPLTIEAGESCRVTIPCYPRDAIADYLEKDPDEVRGRRHLERRAAALWQVKVEAVGQPPTAPKAGSATLGGRVLDLAGRPRAGLYVTAYESRGLDLFQMHILRQKSPYMTRTDEDGRYRIELDRAGLFYLTARRQVGGAPQPCELFGLYTGNANHSVEVTAGSQLHSIDLIVEPIMP